MKALIVGILVLVLMFLALKVGRDQGRAEGTKACPLVVDDKCMPKLQKSKLVGGMVELSVPEGCTFARVRGK